MSYALLNSEKTAVQQYPITKRMISKLFNIMISNATDITGILESGRVVPVQPAARPSESAEYFISEGVPIKSGANWIQVWNTVPLDSDDQTAKLNQEKLLKWKEVIRIGEGLRTGTFQVGPGEFDLSGDGFTRIVMMAAVPGARTVPIGQNANGIENYFEATANQVVNLVSSVSAFIDAIHANEKSLRDQIAAATTLSELNAIDTNAGWPSNG